MQRVITAALAAITIASVAACASVPVLPGATITPQSGWWTFAYELDAADASMIGAKLTKRAKLIFGYNDCAACVRFEFDGDRVWDLGFFKNGALAVSFSDCISSEFSECNDVELRPVSTTEMRGTATFYDKRISYKAKPSPVTAKFESP